jgi:hypothetical protein
MQHFLKSGFKDQHKFVTQVKKIIFLFLFGLLLSIPSNLQAQLIEPNSEAEETRGDDILLALPATAALTTVVMKDRKGF